MDASAPVFGNVFVIIDGCGLFNGSHFIRSVPVPGPVFLVKRQITLLQISRSFIVDQKIQKPFYLRLKRLCLAVVVEIGLCLNVENRIRLVPQESFKRRILVSGYDLFHLRMAVAETSGRV